jgi:hypothetical protein
MQRYAFERLRIRHIQYAHQARRTRRSGPMDVFNHRADPDAELDDEPKTLMGAKADHANFKSM